MWSAEWKKLLIKQKGLIVIALMVLLKIAFTVQLGYDSDMIINKNPEGYASYIRLFEGQLTEETEQRLKEEYREVTEAPAQLEQLANRWKDGKIDRAAYEEGSKAYYERMKNSAVFNAVYNQYFYAKDAPTERYMMDDRGWRTLLADGKPDFILLFGLILVLVPLFCYEYESGMDVLLLSSAKGKYQAGVAKLCIGSILAVIVTASFTIIEWLCLDGMVGMKHGGYPLQSIAFFASSAYHVTLNNALLIMLLCQALGAVLLACIIAVAGMLCKKSILTLFASSAIMFLPYMLFGGKAVLYDLPLPSGLLEGSGYLWGTTYISGFNEQGMMEKTVQFQAVDKGTFIVLLLIYALEIGLLFLYGLKKYARHSIFKRRLRWRAINALSIIGLMAACAVLLSGCQASRGERDNFTFHARDGANSGETNGFDVSLNVENNTITAKYVKTGKVLTLTRDPFEKADTISALFVRDGWCYYAVRDSEVEGFRIYGIDMSDFSQKLIYNSVKENHEDFYGMISEQEGIEEALARQARIDCFFLNQTSIYYATGPDLVRISRKSGRETVVARDVKASSSLAYHNGDIYYVDSQYRLSRYTEKEGESHPVEAIYTDSFTIKDNKVTYRNLLNNKEVQTYRIG
ncbi:ABC transporter permease [Paenibacillus sp. MMS18-CY102]|uniref:ABC transporter permease n=1 Tax=Paenibacillus sp. MMS18-CY102 TaxID=2682849 RepID=UPI00136641C0|nr:ABC transporter permease [Paenibacillus sp. MMS18-CY102]MWC29502.1 ABC transporter permease [Paenibacillus sp. MMS18-CY102]